jgi:hypothetical protein
MRAVVWRVHPIAHAANDADRLPVNLDDLGNQEIDRCPPFASLPVVGIFALQRKGKNPGRTPPFPGAFRRTTTRLRCEEVIQFLFLKTKVEIWTGANMSANGGVNTAMGAVLHDVRLWH